MIKILILQSYEDYRINLVEYFESLNFKVESGFNVQQVLKSGNNGKVDLIICDLDQELNLGLIDLISFLNSPCVLETHVFFISSRFKSRQEVSFLNITHPSYYIINGKSLRDMKTLLDQVTIEPNGF